MEIEQILSEFKFADGKYKKQAIDAAISKKEEITPHLIEILEDVYNDTEKYLDFSLSYFHHIYALVLLVHFEEKKAHDIIIKILSMPDTDIGDIFGDFITDNGAITLIETCDNNADKIIALALNKNAYEYSRTSAFDALSFAYVKGIISRDCILDVFKTILTTEKDEVVCGSLAITLYYLRPEELMDEIKNAYDIGVIPRGFISEVQFDNILSQNQEMVLENLKKRYVNEKITDMHKQMSWWACFQSKPKKAICTKDHDFYSDKLKSDTKKKSKNKSKRKLAKISKKANRKKK